MPCVAWEIPHCVRNDAVYCESCRLRLELPGDKLLQLDDVRCEFADAFGGFFRRHRVIVKKIAERFLVKRLPLDVTLLRALRVQFADVAVALVTAKVSYLPQRALFRRRS